VVESSVLHSAAPAPAFALLLPPPIIQAASHQPPGCACPCPFISCPFLPPPPLPLGVRPPPPPAAAGQRGSD
jgi:hypothetical protein